jgi:hypothetical protein
VDPNPLAHAWSWVEVHTGTASPRGGPAYYNFWSGFGSDLGEVVLVGAIIQYYRMHVCHDQTCHRWAHHTTPAGYRLCKKHIAKPTSELKLHKVHSDHVPPEHLPPVKQKRGPSGRFE